jgi:hypothetical protein
MKWKWKFEQIPTLFKTPKLKAPTGLCPVPPNIVQPLPDFVRPSQIQTNSTQELLPDFVRFSRTLSGPTQTLSEVQIPANS